MLFLIIFGIIDFGIATYTVHLVSDVARMGSRYAMVRGSKCTYSGCQADSAKVQAYVKSVFAPLADASLVTVTTTWASTPQCPTAPFQDPGCAVNVKVAYPYTFLILPIAQLNINSTSQVIIAQ
ncbi:MAG: pilus assembly protein [Candidatus Eremiobacteraeota bacterium]|nr:pilus assembly protein [Candidatus Eremiobacteraeota bacterium]